MIELTCPAEEGIEAARVRKQARYEQLTQDIANAGWVADLLTIEVGVRDVCPVICSFRGMIDLGPNIGGPARSWLTEHAKNRAEAANK